MTYILEGSIIYTPTIYNEEHYGSLPNIEIHVGLIKLSGRVWCEILVGQKYHPCVINVGNESEGLVNKDFDAIMEEFAPEVLDENLKLYEEHVDEQRQKEDEAREVHINRVKQETLFEMKLEAFESDLIKNSKDKELKKMIRKAKTLIEVQSLFNHLDTERVGVAECRQRYIVYRTVVICMLQR